MGEYAPNGQVTFSFACRAGKFHRPSIRVWQAPIPPLLGIINGIVREWILCGGQSPCEHLLSGRLTDSGADKHKSFLCSAVRVERRVQDWQVPHSPQSGIALRRSAKRYSNERGKRCQARKKNAHSAKKSADQETENALFLQKGRNKAIKR